MSLLESLGVVLLCLICSALFSGSETGMYSLSTTRLELEASEGKRSARWIRRLLRSDASVLITILIGNNLVLQVATLRMEDVLAALGVRELGRELVLALVLTPVVFLAGELLPKDLFRRRPHTLMGWMAPFLVLARIAFWPLERVLRAISVLLERAFRLEPMQVSRGLGRADVLLLFEEGARVGALEPRAERLARNVLALRRIPVRAAMVPWRKVQVLDAKQPPAELRRLVRESAYTRLPVVGADGRVSGYVRQLDVLAAGEEADVLSRQRPILFLAPETSVDRALARLRNAGQRAAVVGSAESPLGYISLKDLLEEISGDLATW